MGEEFDEVSLEVIRLAKMRAMKILEYADRTEKQLRDRLKEGEFPPFAIDEAVKYVQDHHYQDDRRYAEIYIRSKRDQKSAYEIRNELRLRGIDAAVIDEAVTEAELTEEDTVCSLFKKKYASADLSNPAVYQKAFRYFSGKGYSYETIKAGITRGIEELSADEDDAR